MPLIPGAEWINPFLHTPWPTQRPRVIYNLTVPPANAASLSWQREEVRVLPKYSSSFRGSLKPLACPGVQEAQNLETSSVQALGKAFASLQDVLVVMMKKKRDQLLWVFSGRSFPP